MEEFDNLPEDLEYLFVYDLANAINYNTMRLPPLNLPLTLKKIIILCNEVDDLPFEEDYFRDAKLPFGLEIETATKTQYDHKDDADYEYYENTECSWKLPAWNNWWMANFTLVTNDMTDLERLHFFNRTTGIDKYYCVQF